jgi:transposase
MSRKHIVTDLLGIQGWEVEPEGVRIEGEAVWISIRRQSGHGYRCRGCGGVYMWPHDGPWRRTVRDFPVWGRRTFLEFDEYRVRCEACGTHVEALEWGEPCQRQTLRYERYVAGLCDILPVMDVVDLEGLDKNTVYRLDRKWLQRREQHRLAHPVRYLGLDEIALRKGHKYATVFYDLERREVLGLVKGRKQRAVSGFFRRWGKPMCKQVVAVCMDLWSAYLNSVRRYCRKAAVVFDKFHVYSYLSTAIDEVRRAEQNQASQKGQELIKGSRWLWLKKDLKRKQRQTLEQIMAVNTNLQKAYLLKEDFEQFYAQDDAAAAEAFLAEWSERCRDSGLRPFRKLAKRLNRWVHGILAYFQHRITNAVSEGINNKIKVIKRRSYGFHDMDYFFLKILNATGALPPLATLTLQF